MKDIGSFCFLTKATQQTSDRFTLGKPSYQLHPKLMRWHVAQVGLEMPQKLGWVWRGFRGYVLQSKILNPRWKSSFALTDIKARLRCHALLYWKCTKKVERIVDMPKIILGTWSFDRCSSLQKIAFQWTSPSWSRRQERHCWRTVIFTLY